MKHMHLALAMTVAAGGLGGACADDDPAPTTAAYCEALAALPDGGDPIAPLFEISEDPTLEQWADFLPGAIEEMRASRDEFADIEPSDELADEKDDLLAALDAVIENFEASLAAAEDGDQAEFDAVEARNQDEAVPAMEAAFGAFEAACESAAG